MNRKAARYAGISAFLVLGIAYFGYSGRKEGSPLPNSDSDSASRIAVKRSLDQLLGSPVPKNGVSAGVGAERLKAIVADPKNRVNAYRISDGSGPGGRDAPAPVLNKLGPLANTYRHTGAARTAFPNGAPKPAKGFAAALKSGNALNRYRRGAPASGANAAYARAGSAAQRGKGMPGVLPEHLNSYRTVSADSQADSGPGKTKR